MSELSGLVAIINDQGGIEEYRDLGPNLVAVKRDRCFPVVDVLPELADGETYGEPVVVVGDDVVTRTFPVVAAPMDHYSIPKDIIWRRATDAEAEIMDAALGSQSVRVRRIYDGAQVISTDGELYSILLAAMIQLFGESRAQQLLARE